MFSAGHGLTGRVVCSSRGSQYKRSRPQDAFEHGTASNRLLVILVSESTAQPATNKKTWNSPDRHRKRKTFSFRDLLSGSHMRVPQKRHAYPNGCRKGGLPIHQGMNQALFYFGTTAPKGYSRAMRHIGDPQNPKWWRSFWHCSQYQYCWHSFKGKQTSVKDSFGVGSSCVVECQPRWKRLAASQNTPDQTKSKGFGD